MAAALTCTQFPKLGFLIPVGLMEGGGRRLYSSQQYPACQAPPPRPSTIRFDKAPLDRLPAGFPQPRRRQAQENLFCGGCRVLQFPLGNSPGLLGAALALDISPGSEPGLEPGRELCQLRLLGEWASWWLGGGRPRLARDLWVAESDRHRLICCFPCTVQALCCSAKKCIINHGCRDAWSYLPANPNNRQTVQSLVGKKMQQLLRVTVNMMEPAMRHSWQVMFRRCQRCASSSLHSFNAESAPLGLQQAAPLARQSQNGGHPGHSGPPQPAARSASVIGQQQRRVLGVGDNCSSLFM